MSRATTDKIELHQEAEREYRAKDVHAQLAWIGEDRNGIPVAYFNILKDDSIKYITRIRKTRAIDDTCSCGDSTHRNTMDFQNSHGYALQCKHIVACRELVSWQ